MEQLSDTFIIKISGLSKMKNYDEKKKKTPQSKSPYCLWDRKYWKKRRDYVESEIFTIGKIKWIIECTKENGYYGFYLSMLEEGQVEAECSVRIISKNPEADDINEKETTSFRELFSPEDYKVIIDHISDISNVVDDTMEFEVSIVIKRMAFMGCYEVDFSKPTSLSDIVLLVEDKEIHVNRKFLSMHSKIFEKMFSNDAETKFEVNICDESPESIIELCRFIYPGADILPVYWYLGYMLELAEKLEIPYVRNVVTELAITEKTFVDEDDEGISLRKYSFADKYKLTELQAHLLNSMSKEDIKNFLTKDEHKQDYIKLSVNSKNSLVERLLKTDMNDERLVGNALDFSRQNEYSDVCLVIEGKKIFVNRTYLAIHSPMFEAMFFSSFKEKDQEEIHLKDVEHDVFVDVLTLINPQAQIRVQKEKVCDLLEVADRFDIQRVCHLCEKYLMNSTEVDESEKLAMAERYSLKKLQNLMLKKREEQGVVNV